MKEQERKLIGDTSLATIQGPKRLSHWILWLTLAFFIIAIIWACLAELDEVTIAAGKVIPSQQIQVVQNLEGGIVNKLLIREGQIVDKNQVLMEIDDTRFSSSYREAYFRALALKIKIERLQAEAASKPFKPSAELSKEVPEMVAAELAVYESREAEFLQQVDILMNQQQQEAQELEELKAKQQQLSRSYVLVDKELQMTQPLVHEGAVSEVEYLRIQRQANDLRGELEGIKLAIPRKQAELEEAKQKVAELKLSMRTDVLDELAQVKNELAAIKEKNIALADRVQRTAVRSPVKGTVKSLHVNTIGGVVQPGMRLVEIVPLDDTLLVEARVRPADIAFLRPGQPATVKLTAYDFSIYGGLPAKLEQISADTITGERGDSFYEILVRTDRNYLGNKDNPLPIIPGMTATVDIMTGEKTVMSYLLKPILKAQQTALRER